MALQTTFNRLRREIGIKKCIILDGNVGDVYLNEKKQIVDLKTYLMDMLKGMNYDDVLYWDRIEGVDGDVSRLDVIDKVEVEGDAYSFDDEEETTPQQEEKTGSGLFKEPAEIFNIIFKNLKKPNRKIAFVLNWADYLFTAGGQLPPDERQLLTMLGKAIKDKKVEYLNSEVNESTIILVTSKVAMFPISFYQGNPEVSCLTLSKPDREEREMMLEKVESGFEVKLKPGETLLTCDKKNEYVDMLDDFTNREIVQMARLSRKEGKMPFEQLYLLFKYGEKDNPWEKLDYKSVKNIKKILAERVVGQEEAIEKIEKVVVKAYMGLTGIHKSSSRSAPKGVLFFVGPTGVGKTELSKALAKFLFGDEQACIRFDMSEYAQENSDQKLIGAPPGYVGYEEGGQLTNAVREKPFSIILFDEIEKAAKPNPRILDIFLQILEDGRLTDSKGETVYFSESVIIFTSNLGASEVASSGTNEDVAQEFIKIVKNYFDNEIKRPEILGRIGYSMWLWKKENPTGFLNANYKPLNAIEEIAVFSKATVGSLSKNPIPYHPPTLKAIDKKKVNSTNNTWRKAMEYRSGNNQLNSGKEFVQKYTNYPTTILEFAREKEQVHPTQKPTSLLEFLIQTYTDENDTVMDNCMGSGSTGVACKNTNRGFIGIEKDPKYFDVACLRMKKATT